MSAGGNTRDAGRGSWPHDAPRVGTLARPRRLRVPAAAAPGRRLLPLALVAAVVVRLFFWLYTQRRYEDALISITHAVNAANGHGLTHHPGEGQVQGFTSAVSVLIPLLGELMHPGWGLGAIRIASLGAAVLTIWFAHGISERLGLELWARVLLLGYLAIDYLQIFFGMAGMETQLAVAVVLGVVWAVQNNRLIAAGMGSGLALLIRPDFILLAMPALAVIAIRNRHHLRSVAIAFAGAAVVAIPWVAFASWYYGSPIPHTIVAKSQQFTRVPALSDGPGVWAYFLSDALQNWLSDAWRPLSPFNENFAILIPGWKVVALVVAALAVLGLWARRKDHALDLAVGFGALFVSYLIVFGPPGYFRWYLPPILAVVMLFAACGIDALSRVARPLAAFIAVALVAAYAVQIPVLFPLDRTVQTKIEDRVREPLGKFLNTAVPRGQSVVSESAGYVGYYGHVKLYDFPGLTSPRSVRALGTLPPELRNLYSLIRRTRPNWIVLRPGEQVIFEHEFPAFARQYSVVRRFAVSVDSSRLHRWGVSMNNIDREFRVLRR